MDTRHALLHRIVSYMGGIFLCFALGCRPSNEFTDQLYHTLMRSEIDGQRFKALTKLAAYGIDEKLQQALLDILKTDQSEGMRISAAVYLLFSNTTTSLKAVLDSLEQDTSSAVRAAIARELGRRNSRVSLPILQRRSRVEPDRRARFNMTLSRAILNDSEAAKELLWYLPQINRLDNLEASLPHIVRSHGKAALPGLVGLLSDDRLSDTLWSYTVLRWAKTCVKNSLGIPRSIARYRPEFHGVRALQELQKMLRNDPDSIKQYEDLRLRLGEKILPPEQRRDEHSKGKK